jgi:hypothetical protein
VDGDMPPPYLSKTLQEEAISIWTR